MKINTYAVNCSDAWLNTEGDDISGSYVKYKDHQEVVSALEARCAALAAENSALKATCDDRRTFIMNGVQLGYIKVPTVDTDPALETIRIAVSPQEPTPVTDTFLAEVRAQGVEMAMEHMQSSGSLTFGDCYISLNEFAAQLRKGGNQ